MAWDRRRAQAPEGPSTGGVNPTPQSTSRIASRFAALKAEGRSALVTFLTAFDPDRSTSLEILRGLPGAGADVIEIGVPFTDPMVDGPALEPAHALAKVIELAPKKPKDHLMVMNLCGRGDKDIFTVAEHLSGTIG